LDATELDKPTLLCLLELVAYILLHLIPGSKWRKHSLTWKISSFPDHLSSSQVLVVFKDAFKTWANITNLYFEYRSAGVVDIEVGIAC